MLQAISGLEGFAIEASDGRMGTVVDFLFDDALWRVRWLVVDCGSWLSGRKVVIPPAAVSYTALEDEEFNVELTKEQVQGSPELLGHQPVSRQMEGRLYEYYGWDRLPGEAEAAVSRSDDERLHGVAEVMGYRVHAIDGEIGHVENFLFDDQDWSFRYLIVGHEPMVVRKAGPDLPACGEGDRWIQSAGSARRFAQAGRGKPALGSARRFRRNLRYAAS